MAVAKPRSNPAASLVGIVAMIILSAAWPLPARAGENLDGFWMDSDGEVILEIAPCGPARCGRVAWLKQPLGPDGRDLLDYRNSDPALQKRPVCGLQVVTGFKKQPDGTWGDGSVYVSDQGMSFSGYAEVLSPTQVKVTGYVALPIFGMSEVWTKVSKPFEHCLTKKLTSPQPELATKAAAPPPAKTKAATGASTAQKPASSAPALSVR